MDHNDETIKIAFLQEEGYPQQGIMCLSAMIKEQGGFLSDVFCLDIEKDTIVEKIIAYDPRILACSAMTPGFQSIIQVVSEVKRRRPDIFVVMGGPHTTFYPQVIHDEEALDAICLGEGDHAFLELSCSIKAGQLDTGIRNMWFRVDGKIIRNELRDLVPDLDALPFPDRDLFFRKYPFLVKDAIRFFLGRGCPFNCSYCFNQGMRKLYQGKGSWLRFKSNERVIEEIKQVDDKYDITWVSFLDDTFNADKSRLKSFLELYKKEIGIPFLCQLRIDLADEEQIELLKWAGVDRISVGIEHGDEAFRQQILNRRMKNDKIVRFGQWLSKRKIRLLTQNIVGFPGETVDQAFSTVELNAKLHPELAVSNILSPYPGTQIYQYAHDTGCLEEDFNFNTLSGHNTAYSYSNKVSSRVKNKNMPQLINLRCFFMVLVKHYWLAPLVKQLIKLPYNRVYELIWQVTGTFRLSWKYACWSERKHLLRKLVNIMFPWSFKAYD